MKCPRCGSVHIANREVGKRTGATIGSLAGAAAGMASVFRGAQTGATIGAVIGPVGCVSGGVLGAVMTGLLAGSAGCALGSIAGNLADTNFLDNRACLDCGQAFRADTDLGGVHVTIRPMPVQPDAFAGAQHAYATSGGHAGDSGIGAQDD
jgi:ribosomal protein S27AE